MEEVDLDGEKDGSNLKSRTPFLLQDVEADSAKLVYVWVVDPRYEPDLIVIIKQCDNFEVFLTFGAVIG